MGQNQAPPSTTLLLFFQRERICARLGIEQRKCAEYIDIDRHQLSA